METDRPKSKLRKRLKYILPWVGIFAIVFLPEIFYRVFSISTSNIASNNYEISVEQGLEALEIIEEYGWNSGGDEWISKKDGYIERINSSKSKREIVNVLSEAVVVGGTKHSFVIAGIPRDKEFEGVRDDLNYPTYEIRDDVLHINIPSTGGSSSSLISLKKEERNKYILEYGQIGNDIIRENQNVKGIIVNLSENTGGSIIPMYMAISSLIPDGPIAPMSDKHGNISGMTLENGVGTYQDNGEDTREFFALENPTEKLNKPVAVIIGPSTASAGEFTALALKGLDNVKLFGRDSAGYTSGNASFDIGENIMIALTMTDAIDRGGRHYMDEPIKPDIQVGLDVAVDEAIKWIHEQQVMRIRTWYRCHNNGIKM